MEERERCTYQTGKCRLFMCGLRTRARVFAFVRSFEVSHSHMSIINSGSIGKYYTVVGDKNSITSRRHLCILSRKYFPIALVDRKKIGKS